MRDIGKIEKRKEMKELRDAEKALEKKEKEEALAARKKRVEEGLKKNAKKPKTPNPDAVRDAAVSRGHAPERSRARCR